MATVITAVLVTSFSFAFSQDTVEVPSPTPQQQVVTAEEALTLLTEEADKGNSAAMLTLGSMYERGFGAPRNYSKSLEWYGKAATAGLAEGYYNVGICFEVGMGTSVDMEKAFTCFENAARLGLSSGIYKTGIMCLTGTGTKVDEARGIEMLGRAATAGDPKAAGALGLISFEGNYGQPKDMKKAFDYFTQAAELGNPEAMKNLGLLYRDGLGCTADPQQELKWYALARLAGYPPQSINPAIDTVRNKLTGEQVQKVEGEAQAWIKAIPERNQQNTPAS